MKEVKDRERALEEVLEHIPKPLLKKIVVRDEQKRTKEVFAVEVLSGNVTLIRMAELVFNKVTELTAYKVSAVKAYATPEKIYVHLIIDSPYEGYHECVDFMELIRKYVELIRRQRDELLMIARELEKTANAIKQMCS